MPSYDVLMVLVGMGLLTTSLLPISRILQLLRKSWLRRSWLALRMLIILFVVSYGLLVGMRSGQPPESSTLIASLILMAGGAFVLVVAHLSALTTADIVRIATLEADVVRDPLTGAYNRRYMDAVLPVAIAVARRTHSPLSALLIDLDHFKRINDTYGHPIGDLVLKQVSTIITDDARAGDTVIRYGGEEFLLIAPHTSLQAAQMLGERIRQRILDESFVLPGGKLVRTTASIGAAALSMNNYDEDVVTQADHALYDAKTKGRNQVSVGG